ncbi:MAG TPA: response regulator [Lysobacter sp.]
MAARILAIDDNPDNLELMRYLLEAFGYPALIARDGSSGVATTERERPDLVLCDVQLPDIDGYEVVRRIRGHPELSGLVIVAVTALAMVGDRAKVLAAGFNGYLSKPIDPTTFVRQVEAYLPPELRNATERSQSATRAAPAASNANGRTILAVDNLRANLELAEGLFGGLGYQVVTASNAGQALEVARNLLPDLILSDVCMPHGNGYDLIDAVKADPQLRRIPFVFISSTFTNEEARRKGLAHGAEKYLFRPIEPQRLLEEVEACFRMENQDD